MILLALGCLLLTMLPTLVMLRNLQLFRTLPVPDRKSVSSTPSVSVLIPARNEASTIEATLLAVLSSESVELEVLVYDDNSEDETKSIIEQVSAKDSRVRVIAGTDLPPGWNGKQHACWCLSEAATHPLLLFLDADVRLFADGILRMTQAMDRPREEQPGPLSLLSVFAHQQTVGLVETAIVPLMHWVLLGFLPLGRMRRSLHPSYGAGCGQMFFARRDDYRSVGGHSAIAATRHDGLRLPREFRKYGLFTDIVDGTDLATVRMYSSARDTCLGVMKNATEGLANVRFVIPMTLFCVAPALSFCLAIVAFYFQDWLAGTICCVAFVVAYIPRFAGCRRFRQPLLSAIMHADGLLLFMVLQWFAMLQRCFGRTVAWKGRS